MNAWHVPVLGSQAVAYLGPERGGVFFDGTLGGGGHAELVLEAGADLVIGADRDPDARKVARERLERFGDRVRIEAGDFADVAERLDTGLAGALLDLGVSSWQIDADERGFSFRPGVELNMRMSTTGRTAADVLNEASEAELSEIFRVYGEERRARRLAGEIVRRRVDRPLRTSDDLVGAMQRALGGHLTPQDKARIFQSVRVAVNDEMTALDRALPALRDRLNPGGVLAAIAYHSLEDRRIKLAFRDWSTACVCPPALPVCGCGRVALGETLTRRVVVPNEAEVAANPRARSAKLRAWRKAA